jgi:hypothetical protein
MAENTGTSHIESAANVDDMAAGGRRSGRGPTRRNGGGSELHTRCVAGGALLAGFLLGYFVGAHRNELAGRW